MRIAVLFGGTSEERDVSIASGAQVFRALREAGHQVIAIDTARGRLGPAEERALLEARVAPLPPGDDQLALIRAGASGALTQESGIREVEVVFLALHGGSGEDGHIQAFLELAGIPYTGSDHRGSAVAMDKDLSKTLLRAAGIPTADWLMAPVDGDTVASTLGYPVVVKPNRQGSTIGLSVVDGPVALSAAIHQAAHFDPEVMVERFIPGRELTVGILQGQALGVGEIIPQLGEIFDYASKYQAGGAKEIFPAELDADTTRRVQELGLAAHRALKLGSYSRVDFRLTPQGEFYCLEANTLPGMTATSLLPQSAAVMGMGFAALCERICRAALE